MTFTTAYALRYVWPVTDPYRRRSDVIAEAAAQLDRVAGGMGVLVLGPPTWTIAEGAEIPDWAAYNGLVLVADAPAMPLRRPAPPDVEDLDPYLVNPAPAARPRREKPPLDEIDRRVNSMLDKGFTSRLIQWGLDLSARDVVAARHRLGRSTVR